VDCPTYSSRAIRRHRPGRASRRELGSDAHAFPQTDVAVANHAESGETLKSFITELRLAKVLSQMKKGDYLSSSFGHNDSKASWPQTTWRRAPLQGVPEGVHRRGGLRGPLRCWSIRCSAAVRCQRQDSQFARQLSRGRAGGGEGGGSGVHQSHRDERGFYEALGPDRAPLAFAGSGPTATPAPRQLRAYELAKCIVQGIATKTRLARSSWTTSPASIRRNRPGGKLLPPGQSGRMTEAPRGTKPPTFPMNSASSSSSSVSMLPWSCPRPTRARTDLV